MRQFICAARRSPCLRGVALCFGDVFPVVVLFFTSVAACAACGNAFGSDAEFHPDAIIQKKLNQVYNSKSEEEFRREIKNLEKLSEGRDSLVQQLVWFGSRASSTREAMVPGIVVDILGISDQEVVSAMIPFLGTEDERFRKNVEQLVHELEPGLKVNRRSFAYLYRVLEESAQRGMPPPNSLMKFIYRRNPGNALHNMRRAYLRDDSVTRARSIVWAEHVVQDAIWKKEHGFEEAFEDAKPHAVHQLGILAGRMEWWIRLYVAEIIREHPELGTPKIIHHLEHDGNELVREALDAN